MKRYIKFMLLFLISILSCKDINSVGKNEKSLWEIDPNPLLSPMSSPNWMAWQTDPSVLKVNDTWLMYFGCNDHGNKTQIGMATSADGVSWIPYKDKPVLCVGKSGAWDDSEVETPCVIFNEKASIDRRYEMWYSGNSNAGANTLSLAYQIGYAFSSDGINWTKYNNTSNDSDPRFKESDPILPIPEFVSDGKGQFIPDDLTYPWDAWTTGEPSVVIEDDGTYRLYYIGLGLDSGTMSNFEHRVMLAESVDGCNWVKKGVVFESNHGGYETTGIMCPAVIKPDNEYLLFYTMVELDYDRFANIECGVTGFGVSFDGKSFTRSNLNPIIKHGPKGSFYQSGAFAATPVLFNGCLYLYFSGLLYNETPAIFEPSIGFAKYKQ